MGLPVELIRLSHLSCAHVGYAAASCLQCISLREPHKTSGYWSNHGMTQESIFLGKQLIKGLIPLSAKHQSYS